MQTIEERLSAELGQLIVQLHVKGFHLDQAQAKIKELEGKLAAGEVAADGKTTKSAK